MTKQLLRVLAGEAVWPPPTWLMRQAGRYLPEYRAIRAALPDFITLCTSPALAAEVTLQPIRRFGFDAAILFSDILILPWALGQGLKFKEGEGPVLPPIRDEAGLSALNPKDLLQKTKPVMEAIRQIRVALMQEGLDQTTLIGFAGAPFTVACYMIEGHGSRDFTATRTMAYQNPDLFDRIINLLIESTVTYLSAQIDAGAEALMLFDSWAGVLAPYQFNRYVIDPTSRITATLRDRYPHVPMIGFPRMSGLSLKSFAIDTKVNAIGIDTASDIRLAVNMLPDTIAAQGNLDPLLLASGGNHMVNETKNILEAMRGRPFIFNLGHGIVPQTPPEHVSTLMNIIRGN